MVRKLLIPVLALSVGAAHAQTFSSFTSADFVNGVSVNRTNNGLSYTVGLASGATVKVGSTTYSVTQVFGFYLLGSRNALGNPTEAAGNEWGFLSSNVESGQVAGWDNPSNSGRLNAGDSIGLNFASVTPTTTYGYHFSYIDGGNVKTGYFKAAAVPEPTSFVVVGLGALGLLRRRRKA